MVATLEQKLSTLPRDLKIAVMGCVVNGPGEAREADLGIAGGKGVGVLFKKGKIIKKLKEKDVVSALVKEAQSM
jgi:(E)-4-hydroxy-3-methylbut-2-enyl-diphosphate synthase